MLVVKKLDRAFTLASCTKPFVIYLMVRNKLLHKLRTEMPNGGIIHLWELPYFWFREHPDDHILTSHHNRKGHNLKFRQFSTHNKSKMSTRQLHQQLQRNMTTVKRCIPLNNDALACLKIGELSEAYSLLNEASITLKKAIANEGESSPFPCYASTPVCGSYYRYDNISNQVLEKNNSGLSNYQFGSSSLFLHGVLIDSDIPLDTEESSLDRIWLIVNYNLALVAHLVGIHLFASNKSQGMKYVERAYQLYKTVRRAIETCFFQNFGMLFMAVLNNQACICTELGMIEHASVYWSRLSSQLDAISQESSKNSMIEHSCSRFSLNLFIFRGVNSAAAA